MQMLNIFSENYFPNNVTDGHETGIDDFIAKKKP